MKLIIFILVKGIQSIKVIITQDYQKLINKKIKKHFKHNFTKKGDFLWRIF